MEYDKYNLIEDRGNCNTESLVAVVPKVKIEERRERRKPAFFGNFLSGKKVRQGLGSCWLLVFEAIENQSSKESKTLDTQFSDVISEDAKTLHTFQYYVLEGYLVDKGDMLKASRRPHLRTSLYCLVEMKKNYKLNSTKSNM